MKKEYIKPILKKGVSFECVKLIMASGKLSGDGVNMSISSEDATSDAESRRGSFWDDSE